MAQLRAPGPEVAGEFVHEYDEHAGASLMGVELKAGRPGHQRLEERLSLNQRQAGGVRPSRWRRSKA
jgi:hypothetical protein